MKRNRISDEGDWQPATKADLAFVGLVAAILLLGSIVYFVYSAAVKL